MDAHCVTHKPANKSLTNIHAFVSLSPTDEIRDMPNNYGYNPYKPVLLMLNTGSNLNQDGMITDTFFLASGNTRKNITWLNLAADFSSSNCYVPIPRISDVSSAIS